MEGKYFKCFITKTLPPSVPQSPCTVQGYFNSGSFCKISQELLLLKGLGKNQRVSNTCFSG